ncbi:hypothetical protein E2C01_064370 [Portunus trituberculatus]|uniref:Uncharacterized protein n=1 Tax=Portunus trituberculatus TaxID=210409 RepID=A0A5B7HBI6_PORTR|nr:hypothetical protein [Portunus trituberculatus]
MRNRVASKHRPSKHRPWY